MTREQADAELAKYGPDDLAYAVKYAAEHDVDPAWRAALGRATTREQRQTERVLRATQAGITRGGGWRARSVRVLLTFSLRVAPHVDA